MKSCTFLSVVLFVLIVFPCATISRRIGRLPSHYNRPHRVIQPGMSGHAVKHRSQGPETVEVAGSSLPDCSHACESCSPCRLVMVSFVCASLEEAETCPMAYKCMCNNKSYPVP